VRGVRVNDVTTRGCLLAVQVLEVPERNIVAVCSLSY
jgi:hypothetical protein